jgi:hypothetical protein
VTVTPAPLAASRDAGEHQGVHPIAATAASAGASQVGPAVLVVLAVVAVWWLSSHGKGEVKLRLLAWLLLPVIVWLLVAANDPAAAGRIASGAATGVTTVIGVLGKVASGA